MIPRLEHSFILLLKSVNLPDEFSQLLRLDVSENGPPRSRSHNGTLFRTMNPRPSDDAASHWAVWTVWSARLHR